MIKNWKEDVPVYMERQCEKYLYSDQLDQLPEIPYVFLGNYDTGSKVVDIYFLVEKPPFRSSNILVQHSEKDHDYVSGMHVAYHAKESGKSTPSSVGLDRAIELGLLTEKEYIVGYSESYVDELLDGYFHSEYMSNKPKMDMTGTELLDDDEWDDFDKAFYLEQKEYDAKFEKEHGSIPQHPPMKSFYCFDNKEIAEKHCGHGKGYYTTVKATSNEHLSYVCENLNMMNKSRGLDKEAPQQSRGNDVESLSF